MYFVTDVTDVTDACSCTRAHAHARMRTHTCTRGKVTGYIGYIGYNQGEGRAMTTSGL